MEFTVGDILEGKVKSITNFGAFVTLPENRTGMVHISEVANTYVSDIRQHLTEGQDVKVMVIGNENGKINLSIKRLEPKPARDNNRPRNNAAPRREGNGRPSRAPAAPAAAPKKVAPGSAGELKLYDVEPKTAAMIMAIVANQMGKPLNELRFKSIKEVK